MGATGDEGRYTSIPTLSLLNDRLTDILKQVANEPSVGLCYVQQHVQKTVPQLCKLKKEITDLSRSASYLTEDLTSATASVRVMKSCGLPILDHITKTLDTTSGCLASLRSSRGNGQLLQGGLTPWSTPASSPRQRQISPAYCRSSSSRWPSSGDSDAIDASHSGMSNATSSSRRRLSHSMSAVPIRALKGDGADGMTSSPDYRLPRRLESSGSLTLRSSLDLRSVLGATVGSVGKLTGWSIPFFDGEKEVSGTSPPPLARSGGSLTPSVSGKWNLGDDGLETASGNANGPMQESTVDCDAGASSQCRDVPQGSFTKEGWLIRAPEQGVGDCITAGRNDNGAAKSESTISQSATGEIRREVGEFGEELFAFTKDAASDEAALKRIGRLQAWLDEVDGD